MAERKHIKIGSSFSSVLDDDTERREGTHFLHYEDDNGGNCELK